MMKPREYEETKAKLRRYGEKFDIYVREHLPPEVVLTKKGTVAKRQPAYERMSLNYYRAQCSFRQLNCSGSIEELQERLKANYNWEKELKIKAELEAVDQARLNHDRELLRKEMDRERKRKENREWNEMFNIHQRARRNPTRALRQSLQEEDTLRTSCHTFDFPDPSLKNAAQSLGLAYEFVETNPNREASDRWANMHYQVVGEQAAVGAMAKKIIERAARKRREHMEREKARPAMLKAKHEAVLDEAEKMAEWDISGSWIIECDGIFKHYPCKGPNPDLTMEIWRDNFDLDNVRSEEQPSDEEDDKDEKRFNNSSGISMYEDIDYWDEEEKSIITGEAARIPRYCADFDFHVIEGIMRLYPPKKNLPKNQNDSFGVKDNPSFRYIWRGQDIFQEEIMVGSDKRVETILFGSHGTTFKGTWKCPFIEGVFMIKGRKIRHGNQQEQGAKHCWESFSEENWEAARVGRWG